MTPPLRDPSPDVLNRLLREQPDRPPGAGVPVPDVPGLTWRPLAADDTPALTALVNALEEADGAPYRSVVEELAERLEAEWSDLPHRTLLGLDEAGVPRAYGQVTAYPSDVSVKRAFLDGGVHPDWRGRGVGRAVLAWLVAVGRDVLERTDHAVPARLAVYVEESAESTRRLLERAGFAPLRYYDEMRRPLDTEPPDVTVADGVRIEPWSPERDDAVRLAHNESFADHWGSEPRSAEQWAQRAMFAPQWSFVAVDEASDEVAGYLLSGRYEQDWAVNGYSAGYTDLLGVRRAWRGRGLAAALLVAAMRAYRADGIEYAELGVDTANESGAHRLYERLGYVRIHRSTMYGVPVRPAPADPSREGPGEG